MLNAAAVLAATIVQPSARLISIPVDIAFAENSQATVRQFDDVRPGFVFDEVIPSWNVDNPMNASVKVELRSHIGDRKSPWFVMADWSGDPLRRPRVSVKGQKCDDGDAMTDTLHLNQPSESIDVRVTLNTINVGATPRLRLLTLAFANTAVKTTDEPKPSSAWGKVIDVPQRAQGNYPNGGVLCSATSVSMLLKHWSQVLAQPGLDHDVPEVEAGVWDSVYKGAGNWSFNVAYAGSQPGLIGYVARLNSISDAEKWIDAGIPIAISAPLDLLMGRTTDRDSGHIVVLVGFTKEGDPVFNDPAHKAEVRKVYKRADMERAWKTSGRTVYLIYPESVSPPANQDGLWKDRSGA